VGDKRIEGTHLAVERQRPDREMAAAARHLPQHGADVKNVDLAFGSHVALPSQRGYQARGHPRRYHLRPPRCALEYRFAHGRVARFPALAAELIHLQVSND
jgi:hypothetical protein